jgi:hypothetical protein
MDSSNYINAPHELVRHFRRTAPSNIQRLATILAMVPVSRSMIDLIQTSILQDPMPSPWAEMFLGSLLCPPEPSEPNADRHQRNFISGVREALLREVPIGTAQIMAEEVSEAIILQLPQEFQYCIFEMTQQYLGQSASYFEVFLLPSIAWRNDWLRAQMCPFTQAATRLARYWGGHYAEIADRFSQPILAGAAR